MAISSYASLRQQTPNISFTSSPGGSLSAGSLWLSVQGRNRVGRNLLSTPVQVTWNTGDKIQITISALAKATGEEIFEFVISGCATNTPSNMRKLFSWRTRNPLTLGSITYPGQGTQKTLPVTLELTENSQLALNASVADSDALPTANLLFGQVVQLQDTTEYLMLDNEADETTPRAAYPASAGYWVLSTQAEHQTYQSATTALYGCDRPLINLSPADLLYKPPAYGGDGSDSFPVRYWYSNGLSEGSGEPEPQGTILTLQLARNGENISDAFSGRAIARLVGYVRRSTGVLDTGITGVGNNLVWTAADSPIEIPQDIPKGYAACYEIFFRFRTSELQEQLPDGAEITLLLYPEGLLGKPDTSWDIVGDVVLDAGEKMRILPTVSGVKRLSGKCLVGGYRSPLVGETELTGLPEDEPEIRVCVSAALAGKLTYRLPVDTLIVTEAIRAIVSTNSGIYTASAYTSAVAITGNTQALQVNLEYPTQIRSDYPDRIAESESDFGVLGVLIYVRLGGQIYQLPNPITPTPPTQTVTISTLDDAVLVGSLPVSSSADFCLFGYETLGAEAITQASDLSAGSYQVAIAYEYPSPNTLPTKISHSESDGCIPEFIPLQDAIAAASQIHTGIDSPISGLGSENDVYLQVLAGTAQLKVYRKTDPDTWTLTGTITAPTGATGATGAAGTDGKNAYTLTTATFTQPAVNSSVVVSVQNSGWMGVGQRVWMETGGLYEVMGRPNPTSVTLKNLGGAGNASASATVPTSRLISPSGSSTAVTNWASVLVDSNGDIVTANGFVVVSE